MATAFDGIAAQLKDAYARRQKLLERMQSGVTQVTNPDGSGIRYEGASERAKALEIADAEIVRLEKQLRSLGGRRRASPYHYPSYRRGV